MTWWWGAFATLTPQFLLFPKTGMWWTRNTSSFSLGLAVLGKCPTALIHPTKSAAAVLFPCLYRSCPFFSSSSSLHPNVLWNNFGCVCPLAKPLLAAGGRHRAVQGLGERTSGELWGAGVGRALVFLEKGSGWHQHQMAIAAVGAWRWRRCSAEHVVPRVSGLWASRAAAEETLPPPPLAPPAQQEPAPSATRWVWALGPFLPWCLQGRNALHRAGFLAAVTGYE